MSAPQLSLRTLSWLGLAILMLGGISMAYIDSIQAKYIIGSISCTVFGVTMVAHGLYTKSKPTARTWVAGIDIGLGVLCSILGSAALVWAVLL